MPERFLICPADETPMEPCDVQPDEFDVAVAVDRYQQFTTQTVNRITHRWAGLRSFAPDRKPVAGYDPDVEGLFWLAGQGGSGIMTSPALARVTAVLASGQPWAAEFSDVGLEAEGSVARPFCGLKGMARKLAELDGSLPDRIVAALELFDVPGAVISVVNGHDEYLMTFGVKRHGSTDPVLASTAFDVGSCAKSYVATAIAILATAGKLRLDDPVRDYVPELALDDPWISDHVTIRDFLSNRTGLARQRPIEAFPNPEMSILEIVARMKHIRRVCPFRGGYVYFNLGFMVCALIVERVSGLSYSDFLEQRLFAPLGMVRSASGRQAFDRLGERASGHTSHGGPTVALEDMLFENTQGAGCVYSSGLDALRWLRFHVREDGAGLISPALMRELHKPHTVMLPEDTGLMHRVPEANLCAYCLGWWTSQLANVRLVQHSGGMFGWRAQTSFVPGSDIGVAVYRTVREMCIMRFPT